MAKRGGRAPRSRIVVALVVSALGLLTPRIARAGNMDGFYLSGDAALIGGAITATARGGGAAWYNPAGLGHLQGLRLDASVNGYTLNFGGDPDLSTKNPNAVVERLTSLDLTVVPAALTMTAKFGKIGAAFGVFVPTQSKSVIRTKVAIDDGNENLEFAYDLYSAYQEYHLGPSIGWAAAENLTLGASAFVTYQTLQHNETVFASLESANLALMSHYTRDWIQVGLEFIFGVQWRLSRSIRMGAVVRAPALRLGQDLQEITADVDALGNTTNSSVNFSENLGISPSVVAPARFHAGFAYDLDDWRFAIDGSLQMPMKNDAISVDLRPVLNARLGGSKRLSDTMTVGGGIFSDRSPSRTPTTFGETQLDFYGITGSLTMGKLYKIVARGSDEFKQPRGLLFQTTVSLSYALGLGTIVSAELDTSEGVGLAYSDVPAGIVAHEISVHLGTTVAE